VSGSRNGFAEEAFVFEFGPEIVGNGGGKIFELGVNFCRLFST
jgi:hypothetical protein